MSTGADCFQAGCNIFESWKGCIRTEQGLTLVIGKLAACELSGVLQGVPGADALNYKTITKKIISTVENGRFLLLEKLVGDVLDICAEPAEVTKARVTVDKPHALRFADSVSLTMEYNNNDA